MGDNVVKSVSARLIDSKSRYEKAADSKNKTWEMLRWTSLS